MRRGHEEGANEAVESLPRFVEEENKSLRNRVRFKSGGAAVDFGGYLSNAPFLHVPSAHRLSAHHGGFTKRVQLVTVRLDFRPSLRHQA